MEIEERFGELIDSEVAKMLAEYSLGRFEEIKLSEAIKGGAAYVSGMVERVLPVRKFKNGKVAAIVIRGDVVAKVNFWGEAAELVERGEIVEGSSIRLRCYARNGELHVDRVENVEVEIRFTEITRLLPGERVNIRGRVSGIGDPDRAREIYVSDDTGRVRVMLWDDKTDIYYKVDIGDKIEILNGYVRVGKDGEMEVHAGKNSRVRIGE